MIYKLLLAAGCIVLAHMYSGRLAHFSASSSHLSDCSAEAPHSLGMEMNMLTAKPGGCFLGNHNQNVNKIGSRSGVE